MATANASSQVSTLLGEVQPKWGWFLVLGIVYIAAGAVAGGNLFLATIASVYYVGAMMVISGIAHIVQAFQVKGWSAFIWWLLGGIFYAVGGVVVFYNPLLASTSLTLIFAVLVIASGVSRIWLGFQSRPGDGWGWIVASGIVSVVAGAIFVLGWPVNSLWLLGMVLSIDLIFQGVSLVFFASSLRSAT
ncbi:HdeD family acid-resistance protein [Pseudomonas aeruginosa]|nr:HdeD family acid-resistance protein [Pseudomonas aeruginosa]EIU2673195.1 HdeD family acid-resistance protein [Pseudomonas aeruginosa]EIU2723024.1 HdeD family acid-resistance protein [Pseudomonas aeruginosa]EIU3319033.1 HdeD family acid-resistance protein [Pseudomonas aeruginosa]EIU3437555.1 HdeD family acid-resistance protein [Pseudomonas aeruginosa]